MGVMNAITKVLNFADRSRAILVSKVWGSDFSGRVYRRSKDTRAWPLL